MCQDRPEELDFKVAVVPCNGIGRLASTITRLAGYRIKEQRPNEVILLNTSALAAGEEEEVTAFKRYPVLLIDGCRPHCASVVASELGRKAMGHVYVPDVMSKYKLSIAGEKRRDLGKPGLALVDAVAEEAVKEVDRLLADEMLAVL